MTGPYRRLNWGLNRPEMRPEQHFGKAHRKVYPSGAILLVKRA
jgi:hypothetical protein